MKRSRQETILQLITTTNVDTQEKLMEMLKKEGFRVTQATVSRDINELKLIKTPVRGGRYRYAAPAALPNLPEKFRSIFIESVLSVDYGGNTVAVKCYTGMANAACAALDGMEFSDIVGTLSGDDTFFVLMRDEKKAKQFVGTILKILKKL